jgi:hypothetical protein
MPIRVFLMFSELSADRLSTILLLVLVVVTRHTLLHVVSTEFTLDLFDVSPVLLAAQS